ncbi:Cytolethal distending toxin A/C domain-containing protein [Streptomyces sp. 2224.1]|uniref:hypothetical protein n=1 Tax=Streptomyces sp. 2224.1 TaxID=1881020 RepID=UPI0008956E9A|nr:hypothetical protein [Streptomyces sp. 2224.1]SEB77501.1 Cytolethal distending toxin A/C domain-containing protein [Streptomyces sp. 2224.1]
MSAFLTVALAVPLSLLATTPAHAEDPSCDKSSNIGCMTIAAVQHDVSGMAITANPNGSVDLLNDDSSDSNDVVLRPTDKGTVPSDQWSFKPNPNDDGSFQIANNVPSKSGCVEIDDNGYLTMDVTCDVTNQKQLFYAQPVTNGPASTYLIRRVDNDECLTSHWDQYATPFAGGAALQMNSVGCADGAGAAGGATDEQWTATAAPGDGASGPTVDDLATQYALTQRNKGSGVITASSYTITDDSQPAHLGDYQLVSTSSDQGGPSPVCKNSSGPSGGNLSCALNWSQATADTITDTSTLGVSLTLGPGKTDSGDLSPLKSDVQIGYQHTWTKTQTSTETTGASQTIDVPPGQTAWLARALAIKTTTGDWTFTTDTGSTWTHHTTVSLPVEGIDGVYSVFAKCTTDSTDAGCIASKPAGV